MLLLWINMSVVLVILNLRVFKICFQDLVRFDFFKVSELVERCLRVVVLHLILVVCSNVLIA